MENYQSVLDPAIPETENTDETIPDEGPNKQLSSGIINQVIEEEGPLSNIEEEEPSLIPDTNTDIKENVVSSRKQSQQSSQLSRKGQQSVGHQSLTTLLPLQSESSDDVGTKESVVWLSQRTGKEMKCKFNQTSFIWERKPLAEILHPSSKTPQISKDTEKAEADATETVAPIEDSETEQNAMQESAHSMQPLEETDGQNGSPSPVKLEEQESQHDGEYTIVSQPPQDQKLSQEQPPNDTMMEGDLKLISKRTGKEMKCSFNQTSFIWERKPLAEILRHPSAKTQSPDKLSISPKVEEIKEVSEEEEELQHGSQQLEALESKQGGGQEAPTEAQEAPTEAPEAPEEALNVPEVPSKVALLIPEEAPEAPEEALNVPEVPSKVALLIPEEAPEVPEEALNVPEMPSKVALLIPEEASEAPEEAPEAPEEAPKRAPEIPEEAPKEAPDAPEEAPETPEEAPKEVPEAPEEASES